MAIALLPNPQNSEIYIYQYKNECRLTSTISRCAKLIVSLRATAKQSQSVAILTRIITKNT